LSFATTMDEKGTTFARRNSRGSIRGSHNFGLPPSIHNEGPHAQELIE